MKRHTHFEAGFRVEAVQHFVSGTVYALMSPVVPIDCALVNIKRLIAAKISDLRQYLLYS
jgi:type III secretory pathway lipoprotein EscJ